MVNDSPSYFKCLPLTMPMAIVDGSEQSAKRVADWCRDRMLAAQPAHNPVARIPLQRTARAAIGMERVHRVRRLLAIMFNHRFGDGVVEVSALGAPDGNALPNG